MNIGLLINNEQNIPVTMKAPQRRSLKMIALWMIYFQKCPLRS